MHEPIIKVEIQQHEFDCGVACLAMLLGTDYEKTLIAFNSLNPLVRGVDTREIKQAAVRLGQRLRLSRRVDLEDDTGILRVAAANWTTDHLVILKEGLIVDTDGTLWDAQAFLDNYHATVQSLLVKA